MGGRAEKKENGRVEDGSRPLNRSSRAFLGKALSAYIQHWSSLHEKVLLFIFSLDWRPLNEEAYIFTNTVDVIYSCGDTI